MNGFKSVKYRGNMHTMEMMEALGLQPNGHLPKEGMPERLIQGIKVWVAPVTVPPKNGWKSSAHRVMCQCPGCGRVMSAGRLHQHVCKAVANG